MMETKNDQSGLGAKKENKGENGRTFLSLPERPANRRSRQVSWLRL
jgi:hypothetical protein